MKRYIALIILAVVLIWLHAKYLFLERQGFFVGGERICYTLLLWILSCRTIEAWISKGGADAD